MTLSTNMLLSKNAEKPNKLSLTERYQQEDDIEVEKSAFEILEDGFKDFNNGGLGAVREAILHHPKAAKKVFYMLSGGQEVIHPDKQTYERLLGLGISRQEIMAMKSLLSPNGNDVTLGSFMLMA